MPPAHLIPSATPSTWAWSSRMCARRPLCSDRPPERAGRPCGSSHTFNGRYRTSSRGERQVAFSLTRPHIELLEFVPDTYWGRTGLHRCGYWVDDVAEATKRMERLRVRVVYPFLSGLGPLGSSRSNPLPAPDQPRIHRTRGRFKSGRIEAMVSPRPRTMFQTAALSPESQNLSLAPPTALVREQAAPPTR